MRPTIPTFAMLIVGTTAAAEGIYTDPARSFAGFQYAYGYYLLDLGNCEDDRGADACKKEEFAAQKALIDWNKCLDGVLAAAPTSIPDFMWPQGVGVDRWELAQLSYRAQMEEDLIVRFGMCEQMKTACLPATTTSIGPC